MGTRAGIAAVAYDETVPSENRPLFADVWFSTVSGSYPGTQVDNEPGNYIDVHRRIKYMDGSSTYPEPVDNVYLQYPLDESKPVYCVGFYPQDAWSVSDDGQHATATVNGKDDLMFAAQIDGKKEDGDFLSSKQQVYRHLQTWIKVSVHADESISPQAWGKITSIRVRSKENMTVTLGNTTDGAPVCGGDDDTWITAYEAGEEGGHAFSTAVEEIGSVFVTPVTGTEDSRAVCDVKVTTEKVPEPKVATIQMLDYEGHPYHGNTIGKLFVLIISLKTPVIIEGTATLTPWSDEESRLTLDGEIPELVLNDKPGQPGNIHTVTGFTLPASATRMEVTAENDDIVTVEETENLTEFTLTAKRVGKTRLTLKAYDGSDTLVETLPYNVTVTADSEEKTVPKDSSVEVKGLLMPENTESVEKSCTDDEKVTPSVEYRESTHTAILTLRGNDNTVPGSPVKVTVTAKGAGGTELYSRSFDVTVVDVE